LLPELRRPFNGATAWSIVRASSLPAHHFFRKLRFGQRLGVLFLLFCIICVFCFFLPERFASDSQVFNTSTTTNIRFSTASGKYVVSAFHPGGQHRQACVLPAVYDGSPGPCLLNLFFLHDYTVFLLSRTLLYDVFILLRPTSSSHSSDVVFSLQGVGTVLVLRRS
jgi:hypothetical protein